MQYWDSVTDNPLNLFLFSLCVPLAVYLLWPPEASSPASMPSTKEARSLAPSAQYSTLPPEHSKSIEWVKYTPRTLALHDGTHASQDGNTDKILLAINGQVFDVSSGRNFYGPNGPYGNFAGRDASRGMAKQSFALGTCRYVTLRYLAVLITKDVLTPIDQPIDKLEDLTDLERHVFIELTCRKNMDDWVSHFAGKYPIVGELVNEDEL